MPFLDRIGDAVHLDLPPAGGVLAQTLDAAVRALNREKPQAVFVTGDITDNAQRNELDAGARDAEGRRRSTPTAAPGLRRRAGRRLGRPVLLPPRPRRAHPPRRARAGAEPFKARGLKAPWYPLVGNHDVLAQGEVPPTPQIDAFATGDRLVAELRPATCAPPTRRGRRASRRSRAILSGAVPLDTVRTSRPTRTAVSSRPARPSAGSATRHGLHGRPRPERPGDHGRHRQPRRHLPGPHQPARSSRGCASELRHRPLGRRLLPQPADRRGARDPRRSTPTSSPRISGNTHKNRITPARPLLADQHVARLADFPQQARMFRLRETGQRRRAGDLDGRPRRRAAWRASRASSPTSTPRAGGPSTSRAHPMIATLDCS